MYVNPVKDYNEPKYPDLKTVVKSRITPGRRAKMALACAMTAVSAMSLSQCRSPGYAGGMTTSSAWEQTSEESTDATETATAGVALMTEETTEPTEATASEDATETTDTALAGDLILAE